MGTPGVTEYGGEPLGMGGCVLGHGLPLALIGL